jgi:ArsR family transcriptional regulator, lead/cadmium/zinc/bismuth-responsive transcriptional repressor
MASKQSCQCLGRDYAGLLEKLKVVAAANRLRLICFLKIKERCCGEMASALGLPGNLVSHHLKALKSAGLITSRRKGKYIFYRTHNKGLGFFLSQIGSAVGGCE